MKLESITAVLLTHDEEDNIARTLYALNAFPHIIVLDSGSTDGTEFICTSNPRVHWHSRSFDNHSNQWNHALGLAGTEWVLTLDADYLVTGALLDEIRGIPEHTETSGFLIPFRFCVSGKALRKTLLPPRIALFRKDRARYVQDGHTQDLNVQGSVLALKEPLWHDDRKSFSRWWKAQHRYAALEAAKLKSTPWKALSPQDRLRCLIFPAPFAVLILSVFLHGNLLDGTAGIRYAVQRSLAELLLSCYLLRPQKGKP